MAIIKRKRSSMGKKAFLFTTLAVLIVAGIVLFSASQEGVYSGSLTQTNRAHTMDAYINNLERDLPRVAYIACFRSLIGMEERISSTGLYFSSFDTDFTSMFLNGTINGTSYSIMDQSSFTDFTARFQNLTYLHGMVTSLTVLGVNATQSDPWYVDVSVQVELFVRDTLSVISFNRTINVTTRVPITDIKDPLYSIGTQGRAPHVVRQANVSAPYIDADNDTTALQALVNNTWYIASTQAPSFLQRFTGDLSPSPQGIVSLVNIPELRAQDLAIDSCKSVVDFIYFGPTSSNPNNYIVNMDDNSFWIDDAHLADFSAVGKTTGVAPCP